MQGGVAIAGEDGKDWGVLKVIVQAVLDVQMHIGLDAQPPVSLQVSGLQASLGESAAYVVRRVHPENEQHFAPPRRESLGLATEPGQLRGHLCRAESPSLSGAQSVVSVSRKC